MRRSRHHHARPQQADLRQALAQQAARIIAEDGLRDYARALRKAAERLGVHDEASMPRPQEIDDALREHQRLFAGNRQPDALRRRRELACEAMRHFAAFEPRLVGPVLDGTADQHSTISLQLFADDADAVLRQLLDDDIPHRTGTRRLRYGDGRSVDYPTLAFVADDIDIELTVLTRDDLRQPPLDRGGEQTMPRANLAAVERLLEDGESLARR